MLVGLARRLIGALHTLSSRASARWCRPFFDIPYGAAIAIALVVVVAYTMVGGFISVVKTDAVRGIVMIFAALLLFAVTVRAAGGLGNPREPAGVFL